MYRFFLTSLVMFLIIQATGIIWHHAWARQQSQPAPILNDGAATQIAEAGYYTLSWSPGNDADDPNVVFELEESNTSAFSSTTQIYRGADRAASMSGKTDGEYFYRVREISTSTNTTSPWSAIHQVTVAHHPLSRSFLFLTIGAFVFVATTVLILSGQRRQS